MATWTTAEYIDAVEEVLTRTLGVARGIDQEQAGRATECPGWTVHDQLAHMVGLEQVLAGAPEPRVEVPPLPHVHSDLARYMETHVHARRSLPFGSVVDELAGMLPRRLSQLRAQAYEGDPPVPGPFGDRPLSAALPIRVLDLWAHEQDIRRAIGLAPAVEGRAAALSLSRALRGWTAALPDALEGVGGELLIEVTGPDPSSTTVDLGEGSASAVLRGDLGALTRAFCGRDGPDRSLLSGDQALVEALQGHLALTP